MSDSFEVGRPHGDVDDETRHAIVAAQLRGEEKAAGRDPQAVIESVASELRAIGVEPDDAELQRRYAAIDPDLPIVDLRSDDDRPASETQREEYERQRNAAAGDHHDPV